MALAYASIPSKKQWLHDSSVTLAVRTHDTVLNQIDTLLELYDERRHAPSSSAIACDLFFTLDYWLKVYRSNATKMEKRRAPAVQALYECVATELCSIFNCTINVLPRELELMFGRELSDDGVAVDILESRGWKAFYAERSEMPLFKLYFKNGRAYQYRWWTKPPGARVLAESSRAYSPNAGVKKDVGDNYGFFVMSMGRDIYMMRHGQIGDSLYRIFHSSYLGGGTVMAAGSMLIERGEIKRIRSDSGHYKPTPSNMIALLQALNMVGVNLSQIVMENFSGAPVGKAPEFFKQNAKWDLLRLRRDETLEQNKEVASLKPRQPGEPPPPPVYGNEPPKVYSKSPQ